MSSYIPMRIKRAKRQITVKLYEDQLAMLDSYGRFIDDSREYIVSQALELVFKKDKDFACWLEQQQGVGRQTAQPTVKNNVILPAEANGIQPAVEEPATRKTQ